MLAEHWRRGLRRLGPESLVRAGLLLAQKEKQHEAAVGCDATTWPEARRQRMDAVLRQLQSLHHEALDLSFRDWAGLLWACARCKVALPDSISDGAAKAVAAASTVPTGDVQPSDAARIFWAAATLRSKPQVLLSGAVATTRGLLHQCSPQDLSNIVWASAVLRSGLDDWVEEAARCFAKLSPSPDNAQAVANVLWAVAKIREARFERSHDDLPLLLAPMALAALATATSQGIANMLWAYAKLDVCEPVFLQAASNRMKELLPDAEIQHLASAAWAAARLATAAPQAGCVGTCSEHLFCAISAHLHERVSNSKGKWHRRLFTCSMKHVAMLCWAFARALPGHRATRQVLRDAVEPVEDLVQVGGIKAQEHANVLWAWAEALDAWAPERRPTNSLKRIVKVLCDPSLRLEDDSILACVGAAGAVAKLYPALEGESQLTLERFMERLSLRCCKFGLGQLKTSEIVATLRAMVACRVLHGRLLQSALREIQGGPRAEQMQPFEFIILVEAVAFLRITKVPTELMDFLSHAVSRFQDFQPRDLAPFMWALGRIAQSSRSDLEAVHTAATAALRQRLRWHSNVCDFEAPEEEEEQRLTIREGMWLVNTAAPLRIARSGVEAPLWILEQVVKPWTAWLQGFLAALSCEVATLCLPARSPAALECAVFRYRSLLQRDRLDSFGPRWTPTVLYQLGLSYMGGRVPEAALRSVEQRREEAGRSGKLGVAAWLGAQLHGLGGLGSAQNRALQVEHCIWGGDIAELSATHGSKKMQDAHEDVEPQADAGLQGPGLVAAPLAGRPRSSHAEFQLLRRLTAQMGNETWAGSIFLYVDRTPCISCVGALAQFRIRWPGVSVQVAYAFGPDEPYEACAIGPALQPTHWPVELEGAVRRVLQANLVGTGTLAPISIVGSDPRVRELWGRICTTGVRPSGKNQPKKKREWQDKLKYFLSHRPAAFQVEDGPVAGVKLVSLELGEPAVLGRLEAFAILVGAVEGAIVSLLHAGKASSRNMCGEGYVSIEDVGSDKQVRDAWQRCRHDASDRLSYFLNHSDAFEVRGRSNNHRHEGGAAEVRSWVRMRL